MEVEILDAVGSSNPGCSHANSYTDSKVNLLRKNTQLKVILFHVHGVVSGVLSSLPQNSLFPRDLILFIL
jgi:hypothetical protein